MGTNTRVDEEQYKQVKALIRIFNLATNKEIGKMVDNGRGGVSKDTVTRIRRSKDYADFISARREEYARQKKNSEERSKLPDDHAHISPAGDLQLNSIRSDMVMIADDVTCFLRELSSLLQKAADALDTIIQK